MELVIENFSKSYGPKKIFENVNFKFEHGKIYGLLGRNGSGKTTLFNCLDDLIKYDSGNAYILNDDGTKEELNSTNLGLVLTEPMIPEFLTGYEFIRTYMEINKLDEIDKIDEYFEIISLSKEDQDKLWRYILK